MELNIGETGEVSASGYPETLTTGGMGPCVGVFFYDPAAKVVIGGHFVHPESHQADLLDELIQWANAKFAASAVVEVYATGGIGKPASRKHVTRLLQALNPSKMKVSIRWPPSGVDTVEMSLDPETGKIEFDPPF